MTSVTSETNTTRDGDGRFCSWDSLPHPTLNLWTTQNVGEVIPGFPKPLVADLYAQFDIIATGGWVGRMGVEDLVPLSPPPVANFLGFFAGRGALNVALISALLATIQTGDGSAAAEQFFTTDEDITSGAIDDRERATRLRAQFMDELLPDSVRQLDDTDARLAAVRAGFPQRLADLTDSELSSSITEIWREFSELAVGHLMISGGAGEWLSTADAWLKETLGDAYDENYPTAISSALGEVESARPGFALWKLGRIASADEELRQGFATLDIAQLATRLASPEGNAWTAFAPAFNEFIAEFGYRGQSELDPSEADWSEDQSFVLSVVRTNAAAGADNDPELRAAQAITNRERLEATIGEALGAADQARFRELASTAQHYARQRERSKAALVRWVRAARPLLLDAGRRLAERGQIAAEGDLWFLRLEELQKALDGEAPASFMDAVQARRVEHEQVQTIAIPDIFEAPPQALADAAPPPVTDGVLSGMGASRGSATGIARVVESAHATSATDFEAGEILIAPFTDAAWTPLFLPAAAVVVETGGVLSHAATVAREYGIPAVVAVPGATQLIKTGQTGRVDGTDGTVTIEA